MIDLDSIYTGKEIFETVSHLTSDWIHQMFADREIVSRQLCKIDTKISFYNLDIIETTSVYRKLFQSESTRVILIDKHLDEIIY